jgi:hypothetical protein
MAMGVALGLMDGGIGRSVGLRVGELLGRSLILNACIPDEEDDFDRRPYAPRGAVLPPGVDLRPWMTPVEDQRDIGSCTSNALASLVEYLVRRQTGHTVGVSRLFLYYNQRLWRGTVREDSGSALVHGVRVLHRLGVPSELVWPYDSKLFAVQPPQAVYQAAAHHRAVDYACVPCTADAVRGCLAEGFPIAFGTMLFESFKHTGRDGVAPMPSPGEAQDGGHAMALVGYSDAERLFIVRNSWGVDWGDQGYAYVPYDYVLDSEWSHAMWRIRLEESLDFSADEHAAVDLASMPAAPPPGATGPVNPFAAVSGGGGLFGALGSLLGGGTPLEAAAGVAGSLSGAAFSVLTGSSALGSVLGGVVAGVAPAVVSRIEHGDAGAVVGEDRSPLILATLRGEAPPSPWPTPAPALAPAFAPALSSPPGTPSARQMALDRWTAIGGPAGPLGPYVSPVQDTSGGGAWLACRAGAIVAHPRLGAFLQWGAIYDLWYRLGASSGPLGYPVSDPFDTGDPRAPKACRFEHGAIAWNAQQGAWIVP